MLHRNKIVVFRASKNLKNQTAVRFDKFNRAHRNTPVELE